MKRGAATLTVRRFLEPPHIVEEEPITAMLSRPPEHGPACHAPRCVTCCHRDQADARVTPYVLDANESSFRGDTLVTIRTYANDSPPTVAAVRSGSYPFALLGQLLLYYHVHVHVHVHVDVVVVSASTSDIDGEAADLRGCSVRSAGT